MILEFALFLHTFNSLQFFYNVVGNSTFSIFEQENSSGLKMEEVHGDSSRNLGGIQNTPYHYWIRSCRAFHPYPGRIRVLGGGWGSNIKREDSGLQRKFREIGPVLLPWRKVVFDPRISLAFALICLAGFCLIASKIYKRRQKRSINQRHARNRLLFVQNTMDRRYSTNGAREYLLYGAVRMEMFWRESSAARGNYSDAGTRIVIRSVNTSLEGIFVGARLANGFETSLPMRGTTVLFRFIRPENITHVWFDTQVSTVNSLGQSPRKETE